MDLLRTYMDESGRNNDARSKVFRNEKTPFRNANAFVSLGEYGESGAY